VLTAGNSDACRRHPLAGFVLAFALLLSSGCRDAQQPIELASGTALAMPRELAEFTLESGAPQPLTRASFAGQWTLLSIGFTHCPDVCPQTLTQLAAVVSGLDGAGPPLQTVFVSVDPQRDSARQLGEYVAYFNPRFIGATGSKAELDGLCESLGFAYLQVPDHDGRYSVDHSTAVALIDPQARVAGYFTQPLKIPAMIEDLRALPSAAR
jgi:protein SCO1/2